MKNLRYEVIVAEDGSTNPTTLQANQQIETLPNCRHVIRTQNVGRAAIRNFLAQEATHEWLLFIDGDMGIGENFIQTYLQTESSHVIYGGYSVQRDDKRWKGNLRYLYETGNSAAHRCDERIKKPYNDFHTCNFLAPRTIMLKHPFDERICEYGYEDVLWGRTLKENNIPIAHIDNPVIFTDFEDNATFLLKTEAALRTLFQFQDQLNGYSRLLTTAKHVQQCRLNGVAKIFYQATKKYMRKQLTSSRPSVQLLKLYKLDFFLNLQ